MTAFKNQKKKEQQTSIKKILMNRSNRFQIYTKKILHNYSDYSLKDFLKFCKIRKKYINETNKCISNYYEDIIARNTKFLSSK